MQRMRTENEFRPRRAKSLLVAGCIAILLLAVCPGELWACPNCKNAFRAGVERAYAASILFLLGMPFALLGGWGVAIYRLLRRRS
jgi:hypothetical protein